MAYPKAEKAVYLFRKGGETLNEESLQLDEALVDEIAKRGLRVHDLCQVLANEFPHSYGWLIPFLHSVPAAGSAK